ncbi:MAG: FAD-binding protein [Bacteroidia bacterium]|nr:FAD-binding protein [Bacteroidia bacterium]
MNVKKVANYRFQNWGKTIDTTVQELIYPNSEESLTEIIQQAVKSGKKIRVVGSGHSWTQLVKTNQILVSLDDWQGIIEINKPLLQATVKAGTKLFRLSELLAANGMAMENMGDIDRQSIAGALSSGTHGTGIQFGVLANQLREITFINGKGELVTCSPENNPRLFKAAQVSLGSLGVITRMKLQAVPAYRLRCVKKKESFEEVLNQIDKLKQDNRNFELFWFPYSDTVATKYLNETQDPPDKQGIGKYLVDVVYENGTFYLLSELTRMFNGLSKSVSLLAANGISSGEEVLPSYQIYASPRLVRFYEMEYGVPAEYGPEVLRKIRDWIAKEKINVHFPLEYRYVKGDDILISPAYGRDTCFISVHMYVGMPYQTYFSGLEKIFLAYDGRPHWGKMHTLTAKDLKPKYPHWDEFLHFREEHDPAGVFLNDYLQTIFFE